MGQPKEDLVFQRRTKLSFLDLVTKHKKAQEITKQSYSVHRKAVYTKNGCWVALHSGGQCPIVKACWFYGQGSLKARRVKWLAWGLRQTDEGKSVQTVFKDL